MIGLLIVLVLLPVSCIHALIGGFKFFLAMLLERECGGTYLHVTLDKRILQDFYCSWPVVGIFVEYSISGILRMGQSVNI